MKLNIKQTETPEPQTIKDIPVKTLEQAFCGMSAVKPTNTCPAHLYQINIIRILNKKYNLCGCGAQLVGKKIKEINGCWESGNTPEECAKIIHSDFISQTNKYEPPSLTKHLKTGACLAVHKIKED